MDSTMQAKAALDKMRGSLASWLKFRKANDDVASGKVPSKNPTWVSLPPAQRLEQLAQRRFAHEQKLADQIYDLLAQVMDEQQLPDPNVQRDPDVAAKLAAIAVFGRADGEKPMPLPQGAWTPGTIWPLAIIGGVVLVAMFGISTAADVAKEQERIECVKAGACTDSGFWVKAAAVAGLGYVAWRMYGHHLSPKGGR